MQQMDTPALEKVLGYAFRDKTLLQEAFTHRSYINENRNGINSQNERLEFLGDSVLSLIVSHFLFTKLSQGAEGDLSSMRSHLVDAPRCVLYLKKLGVEGFVLLGKGEQKNLGKGRDGILADLFEALLGAIYLDGGFSAAKEFFFRHFSKEVELAMREPIRNWKADFQDYTQKHLGVQPKYQVEKEEGPDHEKFFHIGVYCDGKKYGEGTGCSKKEATQNAARNALEGLGG